MNITYRADACCSNRCRVAAYRARYRKGNRRDQGQDTQEDRQTGL